MPQKVTVRRLDAGDGAAWEPLFRAYIDFYEASVADDIIDATWTRLMAPEPEYHIGLAAVDEGGHLIGIAHILFHRSTWSTSYYCYLEDLFVAPKAREKGVGRTLIEAVYAEADARSATRTYWATQEFNDRARRLYDQVAKKSAFIQYRR
jgi:GNAT superfamily N-acetyltransferase